ncbi:hypothetical protein FOA52_010545 [Chlamydomonas sp. UWO 241]|nr:hypothetical protein FOA52_010545 [Chlamydomonas sp. UWO 241]
MSKGLLKAEHNRVRTSNALQGNDMWSNTIGIQQERGNNAAVEASLSAPQRGSAGAAGGGGGGGAALDNLYAQQLGGGQRAMEKQAAASEIATKAGYDIRATDYKSLMAIAKEQGVGSETRGACKLCGCLGHLTRKCMNFVSGHMATTGVDEIPGAKTNLQVLGLLPDVGSLSDMSNGLSTSSSDSDSDSDSGRERKRRRKEKKERKEKSSKHKKEKSSSRDKHKSSKDKNSKDKRSSKSHKKERSSKRSRHSD